jgi:hypothetical protein
MSKRQIMIALILGSLVLSALSSMISTPAYSQAVRNSQKSLYGENMGDFIILQWEINDNATEYFMYRSTTANGPWEQVGKFSQGAARTGGAKVDYTPDARLMDLCYKVEALDITSTVIEFYEPICVPKFVP